MNGAFGGSVGIARFDLQQNREIALVKKEMVAGIPCPPANSRQSDLEAFKCSQVKDLTSSFPLHRSRRPGPAKVRLENQTKSSWHIATRLEPESPEIFHQHQVAALLIGLRVQDEAFIR